VVVEFFKTRLFLRLWRAIGGENSAIVRIYPLVATRPGLPAARFAGLCCFGVA
jgi:hypothetical protein